ncbi:hypothetical protein ABIF81_002383 [Bradyrhizobium daqingense]
MSLEAIASILTLLLRLYLLRPESLEAAADEWPSHGVPNSVLLHKPFAPAQIVTALAQLLNQAPPPHA